MTNAKEFSSKNWLVTLLLIVAAMMMPSAVWAQVTPSKPANGNGTPASPYEITNAAELAWFRDWINFKDDNDLTQTHHDACAKLMADIDMSSLCHPADESKGIPELSWSPISDVNKIGYAPIYLWRGQFDGNGKTISNLYINATSDYQGLFGYGFSNDENIKGSIKNLTLTNVNVKNTGDYTGALIGDVDNFEITQVVISSGTVESKGIVLGGICGASENATFIACENRAQIKNPNNEATLVGGICGSMANSSTISQCANYGNVETQSNHVGGICGNSQNTCSITTSANYGNITGYDCVGGILGHIENSSISNSTTTGDIICYNGGGLVIGICDGENTLSNLVAYNSDATLTAHGEVRSENTAIGGIGSSSTNTGTCTAFTSDQFASGLVAWELNSGKTDGTQAWYQNLSAKNGDAYPVLRKTGENTVYSVLYCNGTNTTFTNSDEDDVVHFMTGATMFDTDKKIYQKECQREGCGHIGYYATSDGSVKATYEDGRYKVASYTLTDAIPYDSKAEFTVTSLAYNRTFSHNKWVAVYVPFAINCDELPTDMEMAVVNNFHEYEQEDGSYNVVLEVNRQTSGTIPALTPCVMRMKTAPAEATEKEIQLTNVPFSPAADNFIDCSSVKRYYKFTGSIAEKEAGSLNDGTDFVLNLGKLNKANNQTSLKAQRWYLSATDRPGYSGASVASLRSIAIQVVGESDVTGIEDIHVVTEKATSAREGIFDLQGRRLNSEPSEGVYIKNDTKYVK